MVILFEWIDIVKSHYLQAFNLFWEFAWSSRSYLCISSPLIQYLCFAHNLYSSTSILICGVYVIKKHWFRKLTPQYEFIAWRRAWLKINEVQRPHTCQNPKKVYPTGQFVVVGGMSVSLVLPGDCGQAVRQQNS